MAGQPIPVATAEDMIKKYSDYMKSLGVDMNAQTVSVSFTGSTLMSWLNTAMQNADELRVFMGAVGPVAEARTTVILWPYDHGEPATDGGISGGLIEPFNEGTREP